MKFFIKARNNPTLVSTPLNRWLFFKVSQRRLGEYVSSKERKITVISFLPTFNLGLN
jgi:hypothetical protein